MMQGDLAFNRSLKRRLQSLVKEFCDTPLMEVQTLTRFIQS